MRTPWFSEGERVKISPQDEDDPLAIFMRDAVFTVVHTHSTPIGSRLVLVEGINKERLVFRAKDLKRES